MYNKNDRDELSSETVMIVQNYAYHTVQMSVNDLRNYKNQYNKKNAGARGPTVARWRGLMSYSFCTCPWYFAWVFLSYLMPSHFIGILSLGPCILFYLF